jgi:hypothetical protein
LENIVDSVCLIGSDEVLIENGCKWDNVLKISFESIDKRWLKDVRSLAGIEQVSIVDIPSTDFEINWVDHWHKVFDWLVDVLEVVGFFIKFVSNVSGSSLGERSVEVWVLESSLGLPCLIFLVSKYTGDHSRSVVASKTDKHDTKFWYSVDSLDSVSEFVDSLNVFSFIPHWDRLFVSVYNH